MAGIQPAHSGLRFCQRQCARHGSSLSHPPLTNKRATRPNGARNPTASTGNFPLHIINIRPEPPGCGQTVARFDIALTDELRLFGLRLKRRATGGYAVHSPNANGARVVTFSPNLVEEISRTALAALTERKPNDQRAA